MVTFEFDQNDVKRIREKLDSVSLVRKPIAILNAFKNAALLTEQRLKANVSGPFVKVRTGRLRNSLSSRIYGEGPNLVALIGSGVNFGERVKYANMLETGATITPKRRQYLTVPLPLALTRAGAMKYPSAREYPDTFVKRSKAGNLIIFQKTGKQTIKPLFVLKKEIHVPAKRYMSETLGQMQGRIVNIMIATINRELSR